MRSCVVGFQKRACSVPSEVHPDNCQEACQQCGGEWVKERSEDCFVFLEAAIVETELLVYRCSGCRAELWPDGNLEHLLIKGRWACPAFYGQGALCASS